MIWHRKAIRGLGTLALIFQAGVGLAQAPQAAAGTTKIPTAVGMPQRAGTVVVKVENYETARQAVLDAARQQEADLVGGRTEVNPKGQKHGWLRFRVDERRLPLLVAAVHPVGKLYSEDATVDEHLSEYEELERRVGRLREHEERLANLLADPRRLRGSDILYIQERLYRAGVDEVLLLQRRSDLERAARESTLMVQLFEPGSIPNRGVVEIPAVDLGAWFSRALHRAGQAFHRILARGATALAYGVIFAPVWIPSLISGFFLLRWAWRKGRVVFGRIVTGSIAWLASTAARMTAIIAARRTPTRVGSGYDEAARENHPTG